MGKSHGPQQWFNQEEWIVIGDFNSTLQLQYKKGGNEETTQCMQDFRNFFNEMQLIDMIFEGNSYTWSNKRLNINHIQRKLDREMVTIEWRNFYHQATLSPLHTTNSDHSPLLL